MSAKNLVSALALGVTTLTAGWAMADEPAAASSAAPLAPPAAAAAPAAPAPTPLHVRPSAPVVLAPESGMGIGTKVALGLGLAAAAFFALKKRKAAAAEPKTKHTLRIAARAAIGVRSELIVVDVDGQSLLLGVTPGSIQRITVLGAPPMEEMESEPEMVERTPEPGFVPRFALAEKPVQTAASARLPAASRKADTEKPRASRARAPRSVEDQVRGLLARGNE